MAFYSDINISKFSRKETLKCLLNTPPPRIKRCIYTQIEFKYQIAQKGVRGGGRHSKRLLVCVF